MTQKSKPTMADLLVMPDSDDIEIDFEKVELKILDESKIDELGKELSTRIPLVNLISL